MGWWQVLESVLKDLNIIERRLHNMIPNSSLLKRFRFLDEFPSLTLRFTITWSFIVVIWCAPQSNKSLRAMRNKIVYIPVHKHWSGRRLQRIKQNIIYNLKQYIFLLILIEDDRGQFKVSKKSSPAMQTPNCFLKERWLQWINWKAY